MVRIALETISGDELLRLALVGLERRRDDVQAKIEQVRGQLGMTAPPAARPASVAPPAKERGMSEAGKLAIKAAQKKRWARVKREKKAALVAALERTAKRSAGRKRKPAPALPPPVEDAIE